MGIVTAVRRNVKNPSRCSVFVDDEFLAACPIDVALSLGIRKGIELTTDLELQLRREDKRIVMRQKAYRFATYKPRTEHQVRAFLATKELTTEEVDDVMSWIVEFRLIDDAAYVERFLSAAFERKPLSRLMARRTLLKKGIPDALLAPALERWYSQEATEDVAYRAAVKKLRMLSTASPSEKESKLIRFLQYRAYPWTTVKQVVERCKVEGILACLVAVLCCSLSAVAQPDTCGRMRLPDAINSFQPTTMPVLDAYGTLYVDRKLHPENRDGGVRDPDDVWMSQRRGQRAFSELTHDQLTSSIQPDVIFWISADGHDALAVGHFDAESPSNPTLAMLHRRTPTGLFTEVSVIAIPGVRELGRNFFASMCEDRSTLILALDRAEGRGGLDLYVARKCGDLWSSPVNLGMRVNSPAFDGAPWLSPDGGTLYFASSGREDRIGKADLYLTRRLDSTWTLWSEPRNLGACINTIEDETAVSLIPTNDSVFIHSWDAESGRPGIYLVQLPDDARPLPGMGLSGNVVDAVTKQPIPHAHVRIELGQCRAWSLHTDSIRGAFTTSIPQHSTARLSITADGYLPMSSSLRVLGLDSASSADVSYPLLPFNRPIATIYFERGSSTAQSIAPETVLKYIDLIRNRPATIHVIGYTDRVGSRETNTELSQQRAKAVRDVLIELGVEPTNVTYEGRGVEMLPHGTASREHPQSRRVDVMIRAQSQR